MSDLTQFSSEQMEKLGLKLWQQVQEGKWVLEAVRVRNDYYSSAEGDLEFYYPIVGKDKHGNSFRVFTDKGSNDYNIPFEIKFKDVSYHLGFIPTISGFVELFDMCRELAEEGRKEYEAKDKENRINKVKERIETEFNHLMELLN